MVDIHLCDDEWMSDSWCVWELSCSDRQTDRQQFSGFSSYQMPHDESEGEGAKLCSVNEEKPKHI